MNEVYHTYNRHQYPAVTLCVDVSSGKCVRIVELYVVPVAVCQWDTPPTLNVTSVSLLSSFLLLFSSSRPPSSVPFSRLPHSFLCLSPPYLLLILLLLSLSLLSSSSSSSSFLCLSSPPPPSSPFPSSLSYLPSPTQMQWTLM